MANKNNYQRFSQIDYCICQYFSKYMASTIAQEMSRQSSGQTLDDMMKRCTGRWEKDSKWRNDTQRFVDAFYNCLVAKNGGKPSKELRQYAQAYVYDRYESLTVEQLAREKVPKNSAEYIAKKAYSESLIGFGIHAVSKTDRLGDKVKEKAEELYQPSTAEKAFGYVGSALIDTATTGGLGGAATAVTKGVAVAGAKMTTKATVKNMSKAVAADLAVRGVIHGADKGLDAILDEDSYGKLAFGDKDAIKKIQAGSLAYKKNGTEYIHSINNSLDRKIKAPSLSMTEQARKESNALLTEHKGNSSKLLNEVKGNLSRQAVPFNGNSPVPAWMLKNSAKQNRALAASFYSYAMEMSREQKEWIKAGGKKFTLKEVGQRAYDYARAAVMVEKAQAKAPVPKKDQWDKDMEGLNRAINQPGNASKGISNRQPASSGSVASSPYTNTPYTSSAVPPGNGQSVTAKQATATQQRPQIAGWGDALSQLGLTGFSDVTKNMGYVLAMLPDMIIGMFTGKNPSMPLQENLMPLAAIFGGLFVKNPLLKMLLIGFGGANLLNKAGHAAINERLGNETVQQKTYKSYPDEPLDRRIANPVMKGRSMVATVDGNPVVINISENAVEAYEKGYVPLNTLANAVLHKYDENRSLAAKNYDRQMTPEETEARVNALK